MLFRSVKRGISSVSGPTLLPHAIPWNQAMGYLMRGKFIPAAECFKLGIANEVAPHEELLPTARRWAPLRFALQTRRWVRDYYGRAAGVCTFSGN